jgi:hypothetical protein
VIELQNATVDTGPDSGERYDSLDLLKRIFLMPTLIASFHHLLFNEDYIMQFVWLFQIMRVS